jgi:pimeloyl-ACP methyl ester carboxylesterase
MLQSTLHVNGDEFSIYRTAGGNPTFLFHHGAGLSAHSFALVAPLLQGSVIAYDCRGHGSTKTANNNLSLEQLSDDLVNITNLLEYENIVLVGHSLGACVIVHAVARGLIRNVTGVVVIDVVEGTAVESLKQMKFILDRRPKSFDSIPDAVNWSISSNQLRNRTSAEISIPKLLVKNGDKFVWICNLMETEPYWEGWFENLSTNFLSMKCGKLLILAG